MLAGGGQIVGLHRDAQLSIEKSARSEITIMGSLALTIPGSGSVFDNHGLVHAVQHVDVGLIRVMGAGKIIGPGEWRIGNTDGRTGLLVFEDEDLANETARTDPSRMSGKFNLLDGELIIRSHVLVETTGPLLYRNGRVEVEQGGRFAAN